MSIPNKESLLNQFKLIFPVSSQSFLRFYSQGWGFCGFFLSCGFFLGSQCMTLNGHISIKRWLHAILALVWWGWSKIHCVPTQVAVFFFFKSVPIPVFLLLFKFTLWCKTSQWRALHPLSLILAWNSPGGKCDNVTFH